MGGRQTDERGYGYWFPLALLGFGLLVMLAVDGSRPDVPDVVSAPGATNSAVQLAAGAAYGPFPFGVGNSTREWTWTVLVAVVLVGTMAWYGVRARSVRRHLAAAVGGVVCLAVVVSTLLNVGAPGLLVPVITMCGLLVLAWYERSRFVAVLAVVVPTTLLVLPQGFLSTFVPAVIVLAAAVAVLVRRGGVPASP